MKDIVAACCQFSIKPGDVDANLSKVERALSKLADRNCQLVLLPEMWSCSFPYQSMPSMAERTPGIVERLQGIALQNRLVIAGSLPESDGGTIFNTNYVIDSTGEIAGKYRKIHLFSLYGEHLYFGKGEWAGICSTKLGRIGVMICYDLRFPELARVMALEGAEVICVSALWPLARIEHWYLLLRARAIENQLFIIGCNGCGNEEKITWGGTSAIISPMGTVLAQAGPEEQNILGVLQAHETEQFRKTIPCFKDRAPEVYGSYLHGKPTEKN
jgi:predicted amidohydrolase